MSFTFLYLFISSSYQCFFGCVPRCSIEKPRIARGWLGDAASLFPQLRRIGKEARSIIKQIPLALLLFFSVLHNAGI
jgi:hypothetical protein